MLFLAVSHDNSRALIIRAEAWHDAKRYAETVFSDVLDRDKVFVTLTEDVGQRVDYEVCPANAALVVNDNAAGRRPA